MRAFLLALAVVGGPALAQQPSPKDARVAAAEAEVDALFTASDANRDNMLSPEEWRAAGRLEQSFLMMDADGNRQVTRPEAQIAIDKVMEEPNVKPDR